MRNVKKKKHFIRKKLKTQNTDKKQNTVIRGLEINATSFLKKKNEIEQTKHVNKFIKNKRFINS